MPELFSFVVDAEQIDERLDKLLVAQLPQYSRSQIQALIDNGSVLVAGRSVKSSFRLRGGELVDVTLPDLEAEVFVGQAMNLNILHEDEDIVIINKPADLVVHPGVGNHDGTLMNGLIDRYPELLEMADDDRSHGRLGIVHRLDKETSGLLVVAKHLDALEYLMAQFEARLVTKVYYALLEKTPQSLKGVIEAPIGRDPKDRKRMGVRNDGKHAVTEFEVAEQFSSGEAYVRINLLTGRTHQIRVHFAFIHCPVVGDRIYGYRKQKFSLHRNFLHATELEFSHPRTHERMRFHAPLPPELEAILQQLRQPS